MNLRDDLRVNRIKRIAEACPEIVDKIADFCRLQVGKSGHGFVVQNSINYKTAFMSVQDQTYKGFDVVIMQEISTCNRRDKLS
jgi:hypothetical protein